jgi:hypothetical protein
MDKEAARVANVEKQRRWQKQHEKELTISSWAHRALNPAIEGAKGDANYRVFALSDPRDEYPYPRYIGISCVHEEPCQHLWRVRNYSRANWARWLRQLDVLGMQPTTKILIGGSMPLYWRAAVSVSTAIIRSYMCLGRIPRWAFWPRLFFACRHVLAGSLSPAGRVTHFRILRTDVAYIRRVHLAEMYGGYLWFED